MKALIGLAVAAGLGFLIVWGILSLLNDDQKIPADKIRNSVKLGMTWEQVAEIREPRKYALIRAAAMGGRLSGRKFDRETIAKAVESGGMTEGFAFEYRFSGTEAVEVLFDSGGTVIYVGDLPTINDLLPVGVR